VLVPQSGTEPSLAEPANCLDGKKALGIAGGNK